MSWLWLIPAIVLSLAAGAAVAYFVFGKLQANKIGSAKNEAAKITEDARAEAKTLRKEAILEAKEEMHKQRAELERESKERRSEIQRTEARIVQKEELIDKKEEQLVKKEELLDKKLESVEQGKKNLALKEQEIAQVREELGHSHEKMLQALEKAASLSKEDAKKELIENIEAEAKKEAAVIVRNIESAAKEEGKRRQRTLSECPYSGAPPTMRPRSPFPSSRFLTTILRAVLSAEKVATSARWKARPAST